jgi:ribonuclease D
LQTARKIGRGAEFGVRTIRDNETHKMIKIMLREQAVDKTNQQTDWGQKHLSDNPKNF